MSQFLPAIARVRHRGAHLLACVNVIGTALLGGLAYRKDIVIVKALVGRVAKWQTRWLQEPVFARTWGFKSPLAHQELVNEPVPYNAVDQLNRDCKIF